MLQNASQDVYYTITVQNRAEIKVKGSRFIATAVPVHSKEQAMTILEQIRAEFYDATHNCYTYRLGLGGLDFRTADDGEPSGTAGKPMLFMLQKYDVSDILLIVTRYFGGVKLGIGGLARAYSDATQEVLKLCEKVAVHRTTTVRVFCTYEDVTLVKSIVEKLAVNFESDYRDAIEFTAHVHDSEVDNFCRVITASTNARAGTMVVE
ncbi:MAG: YigZ family protein [Ignavibacteriae bacterium]|nr:YigZ family protein [Ignavibacteriota bacterium]